MTLIPKHPSDETQLVAARVTAQALIDDAGVEGDLEELATDVAKHCRYGDGYQMAKDLERAQWECDMRIAEVLDGHPFQVDRAHEAFLAKFQQAHGIQPPFPIGAAVKTRRGPGVIDRIYEHRPLTYAIKMDDDAQGDPSNSRRTLLYFDEVEAV